MSSAVRMTKSGFCQYPSPGSHQYCQAERPNCDCGCHTDPGAYDDGHTIGDIIEVFSDDEVEGEDLLQ